MFSHHWETHPCASGCSTDCPEAVDLWPLCSHMLPDSPTSLSFWVPLRRLPC